MSLILSLEIISPHKTLLKIFHINKLLLLLLYQEDQVFETLLDICNHTFLSHFLLNFHVFAFEFSLIFLKKISQILIFKVIQVLHLLLNILTDHLQQILIMIIAVQLWSLWFQALKEVKTISWELYFESKFVFHFLRNLRSRCCVHAVFITCINPPS